jgi:type VI secretion system secreted protein VgrG
VQFHWDRLGKKDDKSSCWIRVSHPSAGKNFGHISLPRVGDEVVVSFLEGDPDQPLITGRVYNAEYMPPHALPANASVSTYLSRSMAETDKAKSNELRFEDKAGSEYIWLQAQKDFHREVENNDYDTVKADQFITLKGKRQEIVEKTVEQVIYQKITTTFLADYHNSVGGDWLQSTKGVINLHSDGDFVVDTKANVGVNAMQAIDIKATQDMKAAAMNVHLKGDMNVTIEAGMTLTLKAGAGSIVIGPATISIDAPMVNINCGGSGGSASPANPPSIASPEDAVKPEPDKDPLF